MNDSGFLCNNSFDSAFITSLSSSQLSGHRFSLIASGYPFVFLYWTLPFNVYYILKFFLFLETQTLPWLCSFPVHTLALIYFTAYFLWSFVSTFHFYHLFPPHSSTQFNLSSDSIIPVRLFFLRSLRHFSETSLRILRSISNNLSKIELKFFSLNQFI